jgi:hypothetical protein
MTTIHTRTASVTAAAVGAAIAVVAPAVLLFVGAGTAQALPDLSERGGILHDLPTPRACGGCEGFNLQPDPPGYPEPGFVDPGVRPPGVIDPGATDGFIVIGS